MMGTKERVFAPIVAVSLEALVPGKKKRKALLPRTPKRGRSRQQERFFLYACSRFLEHMHSFMKFSQGAYNADTDERDDRDNLRDNYGASDACGRSLSLAFAECRLWWADDEFRGYLCVHE